MLGSQELPPIDEAQLPPDVVALLQRMRLQIQAKDEEIESKGRELERKRGEIAWRDARLDKLNLELARLKRWKFGARTEAMTAQQRALFAETLAEDEASLKAQLAELKGKQPEVPVLPKATPRRPRRQALPEHLQRVEHRHEPADTTCPNADCAKPMQRVGEDVSEKLDIIPAQFFVHRHIYGKWACRCCHKTGEGRLVQEPVEPDVVDGGIPARGRTRGAAATPTACRTTGKRTSTPVPACTHRAPRWPPGPAPAVRRCSRWARRTGASCSVQRGCTPPIRRGRC